MLYRKIRSYLFTASYFIVVAVLTACDGVQLSETEQNATQLPDIGAAFTSDNDWTYCVAEGEFCAFSGTKAVRFGREATWTDAKIFDSGPLGGIICDDTSTFDIDPAPGWVKECEISDANDISVATQGVTGKWSPLQAWPLIAVHASLMPSGKVLTHNATNDDLWPTYSVLTQLWDPVANEFTGVDSRESTLLSEMFCVGFTHLPDGSMLTTGNQPNVKNNYDRNVNRFNFFTEDWSREADTEFFRYYPSVATMPNGDMITFAGTAVSSPAEVMRFDGSWRTLSGMTLDQNFNYYAWGQASPSGDLFYAGPDSAMRTIDPVGLGSMTELGERDALNRNFGSYAMYDVGKILVAGGAQPATDTALIIDINTSTPTVTETGSMVHERRHHNLSILADGSVLATGGYTGDVFTNTFSDNSVYEAELWNPDTGLWTAMSAAQTHRNYHSVGMLLPDGRVMAAGNGQPFYRTGNQANAEVFSPPYLFTNENIAGYSTMTNVTGLLDCTYDKLGDPQVGIEKVCSYLLMEPPTNAIDCGGENSHCQLPLIGTATVFYGGGGLYTVKTGQSGSFTCSNDVMGDPNYGVVKRCSYVAEALNTNILDVAESCATEGQVCALPAGTHTVYFGAAGQFAVKSNQSGSIECSTDTFGGDPSEGGANECAYVEEPAVSQVSAVSAVTEVSAAAAITTDGFPVGSEFCADEHDTCAIPDGISAAVIYGAEREFTIYTGLSGDVRCNNSVFEDPLYGVEKSCSYVSDDVIESAPICADEGEQCTLPDGSYTVYYGAAGKYAVKMGQSGSVQCNNDVFGDPIWQTVKQCVYVLEAEETNEPEETDETSGFPVGWEFCAEENDVCTIPDGLSAAIIYGAEDEFTIYTGLTGSVRCSNSVFEDPIHRVVKSCSYVADEVIESAPVCADEKGECVLPDGMYTVYYGAAGKYKAKTGQSGSVQCHNSVFGDPIELTAKQCVYVSEAEIVSSTGVAGTAAGLPVGAQVCATENNICTIPNGASAIVYFGAVSTDAIRPVIAYAPDSLGYNGSFVIDTDQASSIKKVHLIKLGSVTHSINQGQRLVPLSYSVSGNQLQVTSPDNHNIAPPGYYMLFIVDDEGVPSIGEMIQVQQYSSVALISRDTGAVVEIVPGSDHAGTEVRVAEITSEPTVNQTWDLVPTDNGFFKFVSRANGYVLSAMDDASVAGAVDLSGNDQQWSVERTELGYSSLTARSNSGVLEVNGADLVQGALTSAPSASVEWVLQPVGFQRIVSLDSGKSIEVTNRSIANGAGISIASHKGDTHQLFRFVPQADGYMSIQAAHSDHVIGVESGSTEVIALLEQQTAMGATSQQWMPVVQSDGSFMLQARHSGHYMNLLYHLLEDGSPVGQYSDNGGRLNQFWRLIPGISLDPHQRNASGRAIASGSVTTSGWLQYVAATNTIGNLSEPLEALKLSVKGLGVDMNVEYRVQTIDGAWGAWAADNEIAGSTGDSVELNAFEAQLSGTRDSCSMSYRSYVDGAGWQGWSAEGATTGSTRFGHYGIAD